MPAGATVTQVTLTMDVSRTRAGTLPVTLHRVLTDWGEAGSGADVPGGGGSPAQAGDATWLHTAFDTASWAAAGGDFAEAGAEAPVGDPGPHAWSSAQMVSDVQGWLDDPSTNFGWLMKGDETTGQTTKKFSSRESSDASLRPALEVLFMAPESEPTATPTQQPTATPTQQPTATPTRQPTATPTREPSSGVIVAARDNNFSPESITIDVGDTVRWSNNGNNGHTTTSGNRGASRAGSLWDQTLSSGESSTLVSFDTPGTFPYFCRFHQGMNGTVIVGGVTPLPEPVVTPTQEPTATPTPGPVATPTQEPMATPTREPTSGAIVIAIDDSFSPVSITIDVGDTVTWSNNGENPHTTTNGERRADGAGSVWDQTLNPDESSTAVSFGTAGTFPYHCKFHQGMDGTVTVQAVPTAIPGQPEATATPEPAATPTSVPAATSTPEPASEPTAAPEPTASSSPAPAAAPVATTQTATPEPEASGGFCASGAAAGSGVPSLLLLIAPLGALVVRRRRRV